MYKVYDISDFDDLDCALACAFILKTDRPDHHVVVDDMESHSFYVIDKKEDGSIFVSEY